MGRRRWVKKIGGESFFSVDNFALKMGYDYGMTPDEARIQKIKIALAIIFGGAIVGELWRVIILLGR